MTVSNQSFLVSALMDLTMTGSKYRRDLASAIAANLTDDNSLDDAIVETFAQACDNPDARNPISVVSYMQDIMNKACWNARRLFNANQAEADSVPWGCDAAQKAKEALGMDIDNKELETIINDDYDNMFVLHALLNEELANSTLELFYFQQSERDEQTDTWHVTVQCTTFHDALTEMDAIADKLRSQQGINIRAKFADYKNQRQAKVA